MRPIKGRDGRIDYGFLPPKLFDRLIEKIKQLDREGKLGPVSRDE